MGQSDRMAGGGHEGPLTARRFARAWGPGSWGVAAKLWTAFALLILVVALGGVVSHYAIQRIDRDLIRVVAVEQPLEQAVLEMEINAGESARAVLGYVRDLAPAHLEKMRDSEADFARFAADFERLAETGEERRLGREVYRLHEEFKALGDEIVALADRRRGALQQYRKNVDELDELLDEEFPGAIDMTVPDGLTKLLVADQMDEIVDETFPAVEIYVVHRNPALRQKFLDVGADFERLFALYRENNLSADEKRLLGRVGESFAETVPIGRQVMAMTDALNARLDEFAVSLESMDAILDDEIQPLIHAETVAAANDAQASTDLAAQWLLALGLLGLGIAVAAAWAISRSVVGPVRALMRGAEIIGAGDLDHRIETKSQDEIGHLAVAFNRMVENLGGARRSLEDARARLERRVEERTADLKDSEQRFRDFAASSSDWFWEMDADLRFSYVSDRFFETFHVRPEAVIGKTRKEVAGAALIAADPETWRRHFDDLEAHRPVRDFTYVIAGDDGEQRTLSLSCVPLFDGAGDFRGYRGSDSDITGRYRAEAALRDSEAALRARVADLEEARRELEEQRADLVHLAEGLGFARDRAEFADRAKSEFLAAMSHELRTPLNAIIGFSEVIKDETFGPGGAGKYREYVFDIHESGQHLLGLINDILDLSKIESGAHELHENTIDIPALVGAALKLVGQRAEKRGIKLELDLPDHLPGLLGDERKLKQILVNLLANAIKFTDAGGAVAIKAWCRMDSGYVFQIVDTGIGIAPEDIPKALSQFGQVDADLSRLYEGTGLGLPLTKALVELHGGSLDLRSEVGTGTTVTVRFPAERIVASLDKANSLGVANRGAG